MEFLGGGVGIEFYYSYTYMCPQHEGYSGIVHRSNSL